LGVTVFRQNLREVIVCNSQTETDCSICGDKLEDYVKDGEPSCILGIIQLSTLYTGQELESYAVQCPIV
jgi:hypothetical protein